jgi:hypothetical protein
MRSCGRVLPLFGVVGLRQIRVHVVHHVVRILDVRPADDGKQRIILAQRVTGSPRWPADWRQHSNLPITAGHDPGLPGALNVLGRPSERTGIGNINR